MPKEPPPVTNEEFQAVCRGGATDDEIEAVLRDLFFWSYIMRDPLDNVCAAGKGTRADCIRFAPISTQTKNPAERAGPLI